ncbi:MAG: SpoIID/LytB domain-containing protein [Candidatus Hydrogenedentes bacterium]|nr:SpoIID/LytB domain-containing protein [Candidatus Hydrogenedentota bacterium]
MRPWAKFSGGLLVALAAAALGCQGCRTPQPPPPPVQLPAPAPEPAPTPTPPLEPAPEPAKPAEDLAQGNAPVRIRLYHGFSQLAVRGESPLEVSSGEGTTSLAVGSWTLKLAKAAPPRRRFHVFSKTFKPSQSQEMETYLAQWRARGFPAEPVLLGLRFSTESGQILDGREYWISVQRFENEKDALALKSRLEKESVWVWVRPQLVQAGAGAITASSSGGQTTTFRLPLKVKCGTPLGVVTPKDREEHRYTGVLDLAVEPDSTLAIYETLPVEDYLAGVLPSEMPALWPAEALKAQAVAARSDVLGHMALKRILEGFHFTNSEGDRVYGGFSGRHPAADAAVVATRGQVLADGIRIVPAVFSSNCGGWTENNDTVWSSPPEPALRGTADFPAGKTPAAPGANMSRWLQSQPAAYCSGDSAGFRWKRRITAAELGKLVNQQYNVGTIRSVEPGERGVSGRLKSVKIVGSGGTATIRKELPIRQVFGGLPSAMVLIQEERGPSGPVAYTIIGGGRGHGVGLCQHGARGMALQGIGHAEILAHYFAGAALEQVR